MSTRFIDTNILLETYIREGMKALKCQKLLESDKKLSTSWLIIGEFEWVLRSVYELSRTQVIKLLTSVININGLEIPNKKVLLRALKFFKETNTDWTDCLNAAVMKLEKIKEIYSYDRDFDKIPGIKRLEP